jgi:hypothetical protein
VSQLTAASRLKEAESPQKVAGSQPRGAAFRLTAVDSRPEELAFLPTEPESQLQAEASLPRVPVPKGQGASRPTAQALAQVLQQAASRPTAQALEVVFQRMAQGRPAQVALAFPRTASVRALESQQRAAPQVARAESRQTVRAPVPLEAGSQQRAPELPEPERLPAFSRAQRQHSAEAAGCRSSSAGRR